MPVGVFHGQDVERENTGEERGRRRKLPGRFWKRRKHRKASCPGMGLRREKVMREEKDSIFMLFHQIYNLAKYYGIQELKSAGLNPGQAGILCVLQKEEGISQKELSRGLGITAPSVTAALKKLEAEGYIIKEGDGEDLRITRILLSEKGREKAKLLKNANEAIEDAICKGLPAKDKELLQEMLIHIRGNLMESKEFQGMSVESVMYRVHGETEGKGCKSATEKKSRDGR